MEKDILEVALQINTRLGRMCLCVLSDTESLQQTGDNEQRRRLSLRVKVTVEYILSDTMNCLNVN